MADIQRQYTGIIKSRTDNYGFIVCEEIQKEYRRDVFIAPRSVSDRLYASLEQGNKVSFNLTFEGGQPQAKDLILTDSGVHELPTPGPRACKYWKAGGCNKEDCPYTHESWDFNTEKRMPKRKAPNDVEMRPPEPNDYWGMQQYRQQQIADTWNFPSNPKWMPRDAKAVHLHGQPGWFVPAPPEALENSVPQPIVQRQVVVVQQVPVQQTPMQQMPTQQMPGQQAPVPDAGPRVHQGWAEAPAMVPGAVPDAGPTAQPWAAAPDAGARVHQGWAEPLPALEAGPGPAPAPDAGPRVHQGWAESPQAPGPDAGPRVHQGWGEAQGQSFGPPAAWGDPTLGKGGADPMSMPPQQLADEGPKEKKPTRGWDGEKWVWV